MSISIGNLLGNRGITRIISHKKCSKCKLIKKVSEFNRSNHIQDGYQYYCRDCMDAYREKQKGGKNWHESKPKAV